MHCSEAKGGAFCIRMMVRFRERISLGKKKWYAVKKKEKGFLVQG